MKIKFWLAAVAALILTPGITSAQAPAGATGQCKDGTYTTTATKQGACRGHKGVGTWYADAASKAAATTPKTAAPAAAPAVAAKPAPATTPAPAAAAKPATTAKTATAPAPGGGPGLVWLNTASNVYHCNGSKYYGTTKAGKYVTEAQAKAAGAHADHNQPCSK